MTHENTGTARFTRPPTGAPRRLASMVQETRFVSNWLPVLIASTIGLLGCGSPTEQRAPGSAAHSPEHSTTEAGPCEAGTTVACGETLEQANGILTCFRGIKHCQSGTFGPCEEGTVTTEIDPTSAHFAASENAPLALSLPQKCHDNPCDPSCMFYDEDPPDFGLGGASGSGPSALPTVVSCAHALCDIGDGLEDGCSACTTTVCAIDPTCCDESLSDGWDANCVNLAYTRCATEAPPIPLCEFSAFSETSLSLQRDSETGAGVIGAAQNISLQRVVTSTDMIAGLNITLDNGSYTGDLYAGGNVTPSNGASAPNNSGGLSTDFQPIPERSFTCLSASGSSQSTGTGTLSVLPGDNDEYVINNANGQVVLNGPGDYGSVRFDADGVLVFAEGGTYRFETLNITAGSPTILFPPDERVVVETCSGLTFQNGASVQTFSRTTNSCWNYDSWDGSRFWYSANNNVLHVGRGYRSTGGHNPGDARYEPGVGSLWNNRWADLGNCAQYEYAASGSAPSELNVEWYTNSSGVVLLGPGALGSGVLIAPRADVQPQRGDFHGAIFAERITGSTEFRLTPLSSTTELCEQIAPPPASACSMPSLLPLLNEPCRSGKDCQANHRCEHPETDSSCSHSKCIPGDALDPGCDECVERICDAEEDCCEDDWNEDCVAMVANVCDATCDDYSCLHSACDVGIPLEPSCDPCLAGVCATSGYEDCCTDKWSFKCVLEFHNSCGAPPIVTPPTSGGSLCDYSAYGRSELQVQSATLSGGWVGSPSSSSQNISGTLVNGHATSSGSLNAAGSLITGNLVSGSGTIAAGTVLGSITTALPPTPRLPTRPLPACSSTPDPRSGRLDPGAYGDVTVSAGEVLELSEGTYTFNSLTIGTSSGGASLRLPSDGSIVEINVCDDVDFMDGSQMLGLTQATAIYVSIYAEGYIAAHGNNTLYGMLIAAGDPGWYAGPCSSGDPCNLGALRDGSLYIGQNSLVYGITAAERRLDVRGGSTVDSTGLDELCELIWDPGEVVTWPGCPITLMEDWPDESGTCDQNTIGYEDASCSGYDLAIDIPCDDQVPVCNHGTVDFSGSVDVGYWALSLAQISSETPTAFDGVCTGNLNIPAGECDHLTCPMLTGAEHTLLVDPEDLLGECDDRRLDNWSLFDDRSCGAPTDRTETYRYEAVCPDDSSPRWGLLTWSTRTPGLSDISFSAVTAETEALLPSSPTYNLLGTAHLSPTDTQECWLIGPDCPIDITEELGLGLTQDPWMELEIALHGNGSLPILEDWRITYSCVIDQ